VQRIIGGRHINIVAILSIAFFLMATGAIVLFYVLGDVCPVKVGMTRQEVDRLMPYKPYKVLTFDAVSKSFHPALKDKVEHGEVRVYCKCDVSGIIYIITIINDVVVNRWCRGS